MITLDQVREQLRLLEGEQVEDNPVIQECADVAVELVIKDLDRQVYETQTELAQANDDTGIVLNVSIRRAMVILAAHLYQNPDLATNNPLHQTPKSYGYIVGMYRLAAIG